MSFDWLNNGWNIITAISTAVMAIAVSVTVGFAIKQLKAIKKSRQLDAFTNFIQFLQQEDVREARRILIEKLSKKRDFGSWSEDEIRQAEKACHTYDTTGMMDAKKFIEKDFIAKENRNSIAQCWQAAKPMIDEYRKKRGKDFWHNFEDLYEKARKVRGGERAEKE